MSVNTKQIKLQSNDGQIFVVPVQVACLSRILKTLIEDLDLPEEDEEFVLTKCHTVSGDILRRVIEWATYHKDHPSPPEEEEGTDEISAWDANFLNVDQGTLHQLYLAAKSLDIKGLFDVVCKTMIRHDI